MQALLETASKIRFIIATGIKGRNVPIHFRYFSVLRLLKTASKFKG